MTLPRKLAALLALALLAGTGRMALAQDEKKDDPKGNPLQQIQKDLQNGDSDKAIEKLSELSEKDPKNSQFLMMLMFVTQQRGQELINNAPGDAAARKKSIPVLMKSAAAAKQLRDQMGDKLNDQQKQYVGMVLYNGACSLAIEKKTDEALKMLEQALDAGFADYAQLAKDDELDSLRDLPGYAKIEAKVKDSKAKAEKKAAAEEAKRAEEAKAEVPKMLAENKPFDFDFKLKSVDDKDVKLADYKGKVVIVDIWGTWCPPCRKEIPHFVDLLDKYKDRGLEIVGINYEGDELKPEDAKKTIKDFAKENKMQYTCVLGDDDTQKQVPDFQGYPTTLFIGRDGKVKLKLVGYTEKPVLEEIIKTLLDEKKG